MEMMTNRLQLAGMAEPYLGKYFSVYQVRNRMLGYTDGEIKEIDQQISYERNVGIIPDPNAQLMMKNRQQPGGELSADMQGAGGVEGDMDMGGDPAAGGAAPGGGAGGSISAGGGGGGGPIAAPM